MSFAEFRRSRRGRILLIVLLLLIVAFIGYMWERTRWIMIAAGVVLLAALGLETAKQDIDLGKLVETGSIAASKVVYDDEGGINIGATCDHDEFNCDDFKDHAEAQNVFNSCKWEDGGDPHGLDGNSDGVACQVLLGT
jgi:hypothetical protein